MTDLLSTTLSRWQDAPRPPKKRDRAAWEALRKEDPDLLFDEFYATPLEVVVPLKASLPWLPAPTWDPFAGDGALIGHCDNLWGGDRQAFWRGSELNPILVRQCNDAGYRICQADGLEYAWTGQNMVINPPFSQAFRACRKVREEAECGAVLIRLGVLSNKGKQGFRHRWWKEHKPQAIVFISGRPSYNSPHTNPGETDQYDYLWVVWDRKRRLERPGHTEVAWGLCERPAKPR